MNTLGLPEMTVKLIVLLITILPIWKILNKAGYSGWWCLVTFIPILNIVLLFYFAFTQWPILKRK